MTPDDVLLFWFGPAPAQDPAALRVKLQRWYQGGPALDEEIRARFGPLVEQALRGELDSWANTPRGRIALIILIDQFTRSIYRDSPRAFAGDARARQLSLDGLATPYPHEERQFLLMPLLHAEDLLEPPAKAGG